MRGADVLKGSGVRVGLEPLNTRIDHVGYYLSSTVEGLDIVDEVGRPEIGIVYDIYHSAVMGERTEGMSSVGGSIASCMSASPITLAATIPALAGSICSIV